MFKKITRNNRLVMTALFVWALGEGLWFYNLRQLYLVELGAVEAQVGMVLAVEAGIRAIMPIPAGYMADRLGARRMMVISWIVGIGGPVLMVFAKHWQQAIPGLLLYSMSAFAIPSISAYVMKNIPNKSDPGAADRALTTIFAVYPAGLILSPMVGGWVADTWSIRSCLWISTGIFSISTLIVILTGNVAVEEPSAEDRPLDLLRNRAFIRLAAFTGVVLMLMYVGYQLMPNYLREVRGLSFSRIGLLFSAASLGATVINLLAGRISPRWNFPVVIMIYGTALLVIWRFVHPAILVAAFLGTGGLNVIRTLAIARAAGAVSPRNQGLAFGMIEMLLSIAMGVASGAAGWLYGQTPTHTLPLIVSMAAMPFLAGVWLVMGDSFFNRRQLIATTSAD